MKGLFPHLIISALHACAHKAYLASAVHNSVLKYIVRACLYVSICREEERAVASEKKEAFPTGNYDFVGLYANSCN